MFKIAICAGHGINTPGKRTPDDEREWSFNNKVALAFIDAMKNYEDVEVRRYDDPTGKTDVPLQTRTDKANAWGADIYISFHHNANTGKWGTWTGTETFTQTGVGGDAVKLAKAVNPRIVKAYGLKDRGLKTSNFHITRETKMPAILIEGGYMDSKTDIKKLRDDKVLKNAGIAVAEGVAEFAKLKKKAVTTVKKETTTTSGSTYKVAKGDTLWSISQDLKLTVDQLKDLNGLKDNNLSVGQVLKIKAATVSTTTYKVAKGDTLWGISQKFDMTVDEIKDLNKMKDNVIAIGQSLKVKKK